jgi:hypothetical protein
MGHDSWPRFRARERKEIRENVRKSRKAHFGDSLIEIQSLNQLPAGFFPESFGHASEPDTPGTNPHLREVRASRGCLKRTQLSRAARVARWWESKLEGPKNQANLIEIP